VEVHLNWVFNGGIFFEEIVIGQRGFVDWFTVESFIDGR
jgi:hypothetical protein